MRLICKYSNFILIINDYWINLFKNANLAPRSIFTINNFRVFKEVATEYRYEN